MPRKREAARSRRNLRRSNVHRHRLRRELRRRVGACGYRTFFRWAGLAQRMRSAVVPPGCSFGNTDQAPG